jgi:hypothetical protein
MSEKVLCPYCGAEMWFPKSAWEIVGIDMGGNNYTAYGKCRNCGAISPKGYGRTQDEAMEAARAAALHRYTPPIKPMTLEEVRKHTLDVDAAPLWCEEKTSTGAEGWFLACTVSAWVSVLCNAYWYGRKWRCWKSKPTKEEMEAVGWEK